jgi:hypothetical protein
MNKPVLGLLLGGLLGVIDGFSALLSAPEVEPMLTGIVIGSTAKGLITGVTVGAVSRRVRSLPVGLGAGLVVGLLLSWLVAAMPDESGNHYYLEIMLPGTVLGLIVGFATQKYGRAPDARGYEEVIP